MVAIQMWSCPAQILQVLLLFQLNPEGQEIFKTSFSLKRMQKPFLRLRSGRAPKSTETQKEVKWPKSDSNVTARVSPQSDPKWLKSNSKMTQKWGPESYLSQFWGRSAGSQFYSVWILSHLSRNSRACRGRKFRFLCLFLSLVAISCSGLLWRRLRSRHTILSEIITFFVWKPLNRETAIAEHSSEILREIISHSWVLLEKQRSCNCNAN